MKISSFQKSQDRIGPCCVCVILFGFSIYIFLRKLAFVCMDLKYGSIFFLKKEPFPHTYNSAFGLS